MNDSPMQVANPESLSRDDRRMLMTLARRAIERGCMRRDDARRSPADADAEQPALDEFSPLLRLPRATFVTLRVEQTLRGCCGSVRAFEPLAWNVIRSARTAAFGDRRFPPVDGEEFARLELHISVLGEPEPLSFLTEADLLAVIRPGIDGVILHESELGRQGLFLPAVWEQLPEPRQFVRRLKQKAGLPADYWSPWLRAQRFTVEAFGQDDAAGTIVAARIPVESTPEGASPSSKTAPAVADRGLQEAPPGFEPGK